MSSFRDKSTSNRAPSSPSDSALSLPAFSRQHNYIILACGARLRGGAAKQLAEKASKRLEASHNAVKY
jgi:O-acetyl-ADP-ribose deacetylase (regulator of RNase III)